MRRLFALMLIAGIAAPSMAASKNQLVLNFAAEEGLHGKPAVDAVFKATINGKRPVVGMADDQGNVTLEMGRALKKGETLYVEAESADGSRHFSWTYSETAMEGKIDGACQLVGTIDFFQPTLASAKQAQ